MKKNYYIIIAILILCVCNNVCAYNINGKDYELSHPKGKSDADIKKICEYTEDGRYVDGLGHIILIYNDNSAYYYMVGYSPIAVQNWYQAEPAIGLNTAPAQSDFNNTQQCPETLYHKIASSTYILLGYDKNLPAGTTYDDVQKALKYRERDYIYYRKLVVEEQYSQEDLIKCEYQTFSILYTKNDGIVRKVESKLNSPTSTTIFTYYISESYRDSYNLLHKKKCPVVYECNTSVVNPGEKKLYVDEFVAEAEHKGCSANRRICTGGEYCDPDYLGICPTFDTNHESLKKLYKDYNENNNIGSLVEAKKIQNKLKNLCRSITKYTNYNSPCFEQCNNLVSIIEKLSGQSSTSSQCGFSERLILWIANIIRWVKYIIPVAVIVLGILDFIKAISSNKEDEMKKAQQRLIRRLIAAGLIFIAPFIIEFILIKFGFAANGCGIINL